MGKMTCPVCGENFDEKNMQFLDNGNPACPSCVEEESNKKNTQNNVDKNSDPPKRICKKCKTEFNANQDFCPQCGKKYIAFIPFLCSNCQHEIESETKFCPSCGKKAISALEKEKQKKRRKKAGIISLVVLGLLLVGFIIFLNIRSKQDIAEAERLIDEIGYDYSGLKKEYSDVENKISAAIRHYESLSEKEKAKVSNYSHLEEALVKYNAHQNGEEKLKKLKEVALPIAESTARSYCKTPSSFKKNNSSIYKIYEYEGKCYIEAYVSFSATNSFGGTVDDTMDVYFIFEGKYADIPADNINLVQCGISSYLYDIAKTYGKEINPYEG